MDGLVDFDQAGFEGGILLAMGLAIPDDPELRPTFIMPGTTSANAPKDPRGLPFNPAARRERNPGQQIQVRCAVEFLDRAGQDVEFQIAQADQARLTLLGPQYEQIKGFTTVLLGTTPYEYRQTNPPIALGPSMVWQVLVATEDQP